jgi:hypothetical protein
MNRIDTSRKPNWSKWRHIPVLKVWQAVALSLNIDPEKVQRERPVRSYGTLKFIESEVFRDRLEVACANLGANGPLFPVSFEVDEKNSLPVRLHEFADWCVSIGWQVPDELRLLVSHSTQAVSQTTKPLAKDKPLGKRERETLLTIIAAMGKELKIDFGRVSKAAGTIEGLTTRIGARIAKRTIEEHLKRIPEAIEGKSH